MRLGTLSSQQVHNFVISSHRSFVDHFRNPGLNPQIFHALRICYIFHSDMRFPFTQWLGELYAGHTK